MPTPPTIIPRKRRVQRKRRVAESTPTPPPAAVTITQVTHAAAGESVLRVSFSGPVAWDGSTVPSAFEAFTEDGFFDPCVNVDAAGTDWVELEFNANVAPGAAWRVNAAMAGITPAVAWPANGIVS